MDSYVILGATPCKEKCSQVGEENYNTRAVQECRAHIKAIQKKLGPEPEGAALQVKAFQLDFGTHYEVVCAYDSKNAAAMEYANRCELEAPQRWSEVGMKSPHVRHAQGRG